MSIVRENIMSIPNYTPYCGRDAKCVGAYPRTHFNGKQFVCHACGWESEFPDDFIAKYIETWHKEKEITK